MEGGQEEAARKVMWKHTQQSPWRIPDRGICAPWQPTASWVVCEEMGAVSEAAGSYRLLSERFDPPKTPSQPIRVPGCLWHRLGLVNLSAPYPKTNQFSQKSPTLSPPPIRALSTNKPGKQTQHIPCILPAFELFPFCSVLSAVLCPPWRDSTDSHSTLCGSALCDSTSLCHLSLSQKCSSKFEISPKYLPPCRDRSLQVVSV